MHYKLFSYNFAEYSAKDIIKSVEDHGYVVGKYQGKAGTQHGFRIEGTNIVIRPPYIEYVKNLKFNPLLAGSASVWWGYYDRMYFDDSGKRKQALLDEHDKLFMKLKRQFQMKRGEVPKSIKDEDWLRAAMQ